MGGIDDTKSMILDRIRNNAGLIFIETEFLCFDNNISVYYNIPENRNSLFEDYPYIRRFNFTSENIIYFKIRKDIDLTEDEYRLLVIENEISDFRRDYISENENEYLIPHSHQLNMCN